MERKHTAIAEVITQEQADGQYTSILRIVAVVGGDKYFERKYGPGAKTEVVAQAQAAKQTEMQKYLIQE